VRLRTLTALLLVLAACVTAGCGADEETKPSIPAAASTDLQSRLSEVERRMAAGGGACTDIVKDTEPAVHSILAALPSSVDPDVRDALQESFDHLFDLTSQQCDKTKGQQTDTQTDTNTTPTDTNTTPTDTNTTPTDTNTTPTETNTTPTDTQPTDTAPPEQPGNSGGAQGPGL
jgi:hypothetical protein